jgi:ATP-dependent DNA helicase PIF1
MDQELALEIMLNGENVLLTGPAGSGKTYVLNEFIRMSKREGKKVAVTATTGLAATHLSGTTIHAWSGIGIWDVLPRHHIDNYSKSRRDLIEQADILIIDEISMLHDFRLDLVDQVLKDVRDSEAPFGGIQLVLCGDFFQLPPVNRRDSEHTGSFVVNASSWRDLDPVICYLDEQHRQNDDVFLEILNAMRAGDVRRHHAEALLKRQNAVLTEQAVTELHTTNVDVDRINQTELRKLQGEEHEYYQEMTGSANYRESLQRSCLALETLVLKKGALVMCIKNNPERKYANGTLGTVVDFEKATDYPIVEIHSGRRLTITPETWELRDGDKKRAGLTQIPLRLAWAITVHKSQGMTLDAARIDLRRAFVEGMGYVALSRVRRLDALSLAGINQMALRVSPEALEIDTSLRARAQKDAKKFEPLRKNAATRKAQAEKDAKNPQKAKAPKNAGWAAKIEAMREVYPNAFRPWSNDDDIKLQELFVGGKGWKAISESLGRQPGSIKARLQKHYGEEVVISI